MNQQYRRSLATIVALAGVVMAGCSSSDDSSSLSASAEATETFTEAPIVWVDLLTLASQFGDTIADLSGDRIVTVWDDLDARLLALASSVGAGAPTDDQRAEWAAFAVDARELDHSIDDDSAQLGADVTAAWDRFIAEVDVVDAAVSTTPGTGAGR
jgi:hypothetical protein